MKNPNPLLASRPLPAKASNTNPVYVHLLPSESQFKATSLGRVDPLVADSRLISKTTLNRGHFESDRYSCITPSTQRLRYVEQARRADFRGRGGAVLPDMSFWAWVISIFDAFAAGS